MNTHITTLALVSIVSATGATVAPVKADEAPGNAWQHNLLFAPSPMQIEIEKRGRVVIYDGLRDVDIDRVMDQQFHRVQSMMFVRTVVTDTAGVPAADPETGILLMEDDGCD